MSVAMVDPESDCALLHDEMCASYWINDDVHVHFLTVGDLVVVSSVEDTYYLVVNDEGTKFQIEHPFMEDD